MSSKIIEISSLLVYPFVFAGLICALKSAISREMNQEYRGIKTSPREFKKDTPFISFFQEMPVVILSYDVGIVTWLKSNNLLFGIVLTSWIVLILLHFILIILNENLKRVFNKSKRDEICFGMLVTWKYTKHALISLMLCFYYHGYILYVISHSL